LWLVIDQPAASQVVENHLEWTSRYTCTTRTDALEIVQYVYFCIICVWSSMVINKFWKKKMPEDARWMLAMLYTEMLIFILLLVINSLIPLNDDQMYNVKVPF